MNIQFVVFSTSWELIEKLKAETPAVTCLQYTVGDGPKATLEARLDALWVSLMSAVERFGASPPFPLYKAIVIRTPAAEISRGLPRFVIAGVAVPADHRSDPKRDLEIKVSALLKAVLEFNKEGLEQITRVGLLPDDLGFDRLSLPEAAQSIEDIYNEVMPPS